MTVNNLTPYINFSTYLTGLAKRFPGQTYNGIQLAPLVPVTAKEGTYAVYGREALRADGDLRAVGAEAKAIQYSKSTATFKTELHSKRIPIYLDAENAALGQSLQSMREGATFTLVEDMRLNREKEIATLATADASYTSGAYQNYGNATAKWDTSSTSLMADVQEAINYIRSRAGVMPNVIFIPAAVQIAMATQDPWKSQLNYNNVSQGLTPYGLPATFPQFGLRIITLEAIQDVSGLGGSATSLSDVWSDYVIVAHVNPSWVNRGITFMSTFNYQDAQFGGADIGMWEYMDDSKSVQWVEGKNWRDVQVIEPLAGYLIKDTLT